VHQARVPPGVARTKDDEERKRAVATLEETRLRRRLTQRALAARAGVSLSTIQAIEAGRAGRVRFGTMERLADVLGVEPEAIDDFAPSFRPRRRPPAPSADQADPGPGDQPGAGSTSAR
jgi:transcriptional regulator with XRE-family HTH domain